VKVADLIAKLQDFPPNAEVWVLSADSQSQEASWVHHTDADRAVIMSASFSEVV
jgi:hypothetical protein